jgi:hypothetical protein
MIEPKTMYHIINNMRECFLMQDRVQSKGAAYIELKIMDDSSAHSLQSITIHFQKDITRSSSGNHIGI